MLAEQVKKWPEKWVQQGIEQGIEQGIVKVVRNLLRSTNMTDEQIADLSGMEIDKVQALRSELNNQ